MIVIKNRLSSHLMSLEEWRVNKNTFEMFKTFHNLALRTFSSSQEATHGANYLFSTTYSLQFCHCLAASHLLCTKVPNVMTFDSDVIQLDRIYVHCFARLLKLVWQAHTHLKGFNSKSKRARRTHVITEVHVSQLGDSLSFMFFFSWSCGIYFNHLL